MTEPRAAVLYTTFADIDQVRTFADAVLTAGLAACVNALPPMRSFFRWEGELKDEPEIACLVKSRPELEDALMAFARAHHPYETPALLWFEAASVDAAFGHWIKAETGG